MTAFYENGSLWADSVYKQNLTKQYNSKEAIFMIKIMFLCTANSCRSQMAEGLARELGRGVIEPCSAGIMTADVQPRAIAVMKEIGIDITAQKSKLIEPRLLKQIDMVISLCHHADALCPSLPEGIKKLHWPIKDPVGMIGTEEMIMREFRRARDEIKKLIIKFIEDLKLSKK